MATYSPSVQLPSSLPNQMTTAIIADRSKIYQLTYPKRELFPRYAGKQTELGKEQTLPNSR